MEINYLFFIDFLFQKFSNPSATKVLDFGCGDGKIVLEMRDRGFDFYGVESYYDGDRNTFEKNKTESMFIKHYTPPSKYHTLTNILIIFIQIKFLNIFKT